jgi:hypothetical protein
MAQIDMGSIIAMPWGMVKSRAGRRSDLTNVVMFEHCAHFQPRRRVGTDPLPDLGYVPSLETGIFLALRSLGSRL